LAYVKDHKLIEKLWASPSKNPLDARQSYKNLFEQVSFPTPRESKLLSREERERLDKLWPAGEHEARARLGNFMEGHVSDYSENRNIPGYEGGTSAMSVHFSSGTMSVRQAIAVVASANKGKLDSGNAGHTGYVKHKTFSDTYRLSITN
jgi:deoxyribodipyrimidine photo-lyase